MVENAAAQEGTYRIKNFRKVNAVTGSTFGQETYTVQCTWDQEYLHDVDSKRVMGMLIEPGHKKGEVVPTRDGDLIFKKTEKGWEGLDGKIY